MASDSKQVLPHRPTRAGRVSLSGLEGIVADLDALIRQSGGADKLDLADLQQAQFILKKLVARSVPLR